MIWLKIKIDNMPYDKSTQKKYGENPMKKRSGFKMKSSPAKIYGKKASAVKDYKKGYYGA